MSETRQHVVVQAVHWIRGTSPDKMKGLFYCMFDEVILTKVRAGSPWLLQKYVMSGPSCPRLMFCEAFNCSWKMVLNTFLLGSALINSIENWGRISAEDPSSLLIIVPLLLSRVPSCCCLLYQCWILTYLATIIKNLLFNHICIN